MTEETKYYSVNDFAALLSVDAQTVYRWIREGKISAVQARRWTAIRIPASEIDRMNTQLRTG